MEQVYTPTKDFRVLVRCFTYNHSKYIEDALNGFVLQKTDFPFVCLIMDDASTDGEQEVIKAWMERECDMEKVENVEIEDSFIIIVPHKSNSKCTFAFYFLKENLFGSREKKMRMVKPWREHSEYEAICEGDDYWIYPGKLQKQVLFLDEHKNFSLCFHNAVLLYDDESQPSNIFNKLTRSVSIDLSQLINNWVIPTASILVRTTVTIEYPQWSKSIYSGDMTLALLAYSVGNIYSMYDVMSVYRKNYLPDSATSMMTGNSSVMMSQHALLYKLYNEHTNFRFNDILLPVIKYKEKMSFYCRYREKSVIYAFIKMPVFSLRYQLSKIKGQ